MAKLFLGLAIALMLAAAVLGFLAKGNIDTLQGQLKQTKGQLESTKTTLRKTEGDLKKTTEDLTAANTKIESQTTEIGGLKKDKEELGTQLATVKADLETKSKFISELEEKLKGTDPTKIVDVNTIITERDQLKNDLTKAQAELAEQRQLADTLTAKMGEKDAALGVAQSEVNRYRANVARNGLTGRVLAVNPGWNFVVLSVGDRQGAATGATMVVTRDGRAIGKARITSVEPSTAIADLIPGSFARGVTVQPGDVVVYEGSRARPNTLATPGPGAPLPQN
jgi:small-conductance mechanosensitive channel